MCGRLAQESRRNQSMISGVGKRRVACCQGRNPAFHEKLAAVLAFDDHVVAINLDGDVLSADLLCGPARPLGNFGLGVACRAFQVIEIGNALGQVAAIEAVGRCRDQGIETLCNATCHGAHGVADTGMGRNHRFGMQAPPDFGLIGRCRCAHGHDGALEVDGNIEQVAFLA